MKKTSAITTTFYRRPDITQNISIFFSPPLLSRPARSKRFVVRESGPRDSIDLLSISVHCSSTKSPSISKADKHQVNGLKMEVVWLTLYRCWTPPQTPPAKPHADTFTIRITHQDNKPPRPRGCHFFQVRALQPPHAPNFIISSNTHAITHIGDSWVVSGLWGGRRVGAEVKDKPLIHLC